MCGRATLKTPAEAIAEALDVSADEVAALIDRPRYNLAPTEFLVAIRRDEGDPRRHAVLVRWGLVPSWARDTKDAASRINARGETLFEKPAFRSAARVRRCAAVLDGFYEWRRGPDPKAKQAFYIRRRDGRPFAVAGVWERAWLSGADAPPLDSCALVTTTPNAVLAPIHDRMPVILDGDALARWLDPSVRDPSALAPLLVPAAPDAFERIPVSSRVNSVRNDDPSLVEQVEEAAQGGDGPPKEKAPKGRRRVTKADEGPTLFDHLPGGVA